MFVRGAEWFLSSSIDRRTVLKGASSAALGLLASACGPVGSDHRGRRRRLDRARAIGRLRRLGRRPRDGLRLQRRLEGCHADRRRQPAGARDPAARRLGALVVERADVLGRSADLGIEGTNGRKARQEMGSPFSATATTNSRKCTLVVSWSPIGINGAIRIEGPAACRACQRKPDAEFAFVALASLCYSSDSRKQIGSSPATTRRSPRSESPGLSPRFLRFDQVIDGFGRNRKSPVPTRAEPPVFPMQ